MACKALFLDRDGVINIDHGYVHRPEQLQLIEGITELLVAARKAGYLVIIVTNQSGIGRGYYSEEQFHSFMAWLDEFFRAQGAGFDGVYFCPYHAEHGIGAYRRQSDYRKPGPGMIMQAVLDHDIDLAASILVGDQISDMEAGDNAGVGTLLYFGEASKCPENAIAIETLHQAISYLK